MSEQLQFRTHHATYRYANRSPLEYTRIILAWIFNIIKFVSSRAGSIWNTKIILICSNKTQTLKNVFYLH